MTSVAPAPHPVSSSRQFAPVSSAAELQVVARLAQEIWQEYYVPLIGQDQVDYMVRKFQTVEAMQDQLRQGFEYFLVRQEGRDVGYMGWQAQPEQQRMFISKLYLHASMRRSGTGRACMEFIEVAARQRGCGVLWLTVNKGNPAVQAYRRLGFVIAESLVMDIGGGFVMDDYRMEKSISGSRESHQACDRKVAISPGPHERVDG